MSSISAVPSVTVVETSNTRYNEFQDERTTGIQTASPLISQLPPELLAEILQLALPSITLTVTLDEVRLFFYMRMLYTMRRVAKGWQDIIDGTPTFWEFVLDSLPTHVNDMTVLRSSNNPLYVMHAHSKYATAKIYPSPAAFFQAFTHVLPCWSGYHGPLVSEYLQDAVPLLQNLDIRGKFQEGSTVEPMELLGGFTTSLRHVQLYGVSIRWKMGLFTQLKTLKLEQLGWDGLMTTHLLDFLRSSPGLQDLRLRFVHAIVNNPPSSQRITLQSLQSIVIYNCEDDMIVSILRQIQAPSCIKVYLNLQLEDELSLSRFLNETFQPFQHVVRTLHKRVGLSKMKLSAFSFQWRTVS
ncbi:hypothetical protein FS837_010843 [Tulasnella sp. UAMH 9824]|nr:hypothetical protein FS837_010843 [Tulasnella sp. UAMH 9824]